MWNIIYYLFPCMKPEPEEETYQVFDETIFDIYNIYPDQNVKISFQL